MTYNPFILGLVVLTHKQMGKIEPRTNDGPDQNLNSGPLNIVSYTIPNELSGAGKLYLYWSYCHIPTYMYLNNFCL